MKFDLRHYLAVASHFPRFSYRWWLALLHDGIEDEWLPISGRPLPNRFKNDVQTLSRNCRAASGTYQGYIGAIGTFGYDDVRAVKIADLTENLKRCPSSLVSRYERALETLQPNL